MMALPSPARSFFSILLLQEQIFTHSLSRAAISISVSTLKGATTAKFAHSSHGRTFLSSNAASFLHSPLCLP